MVSSVNILYVAEPTVPYCLYVCVCVFILVLLRVFNLVDGNVVKASSTDR